MSASLAKSPDELKRKLWEDPSLGIQHDLYRIQDELFPVFETAQRKTAGAKAALAVQARP